MKVLDFTSRVHILGVEIAVLYGRLRETGETRGGTPTAEALLWALCVRRESVHPFPDPNSGFLKTKFRNFPDCAGACFGCRL